MASLNHVFLMGNLTRDPEMRYTPSGTAICKLGLAVNRRYRDTRTNEFREETTFVDIDVWGRQAETANQYLAKGRSVFIEGRLRYDQWEDKQTGQRRSKLNVVCERWQFVGSSGSGGSSGGGGEQQGYRGQAAPTTAPRPANFSQPESSGETTTPENLQPPEDDIPF